MLYIRVGENLQNHIKALRQKHDLTQDELAEKLEVSRQTIISLEKERYNPSLILAYKIAKLFELQIEEVFIFKEAEKNG